jgi:tetratricopeptide (TPR) repeat protein
VRSGALARFVGGLLSLAQEAPACYSGGPFCVLHREARRWPLPGPLVDTLLKDPLEWYDNERAVLVGAVRQAAQAGAVDLCWSLAVGAVTLFQSRSYLGDWRETHDIALEVAQRARDLRGQAAMLYSIGSLHIAQQRYDQARRVLAEAARLFADIGDDQALALVIRYIAYVDAVAGRLVEAGAGYERALATFNRMGDKVAAAYVLNGLSQVKLVQDDVHAAKELLAEALRLSREARCRRMEAQVLYRMGEAELQSGQLAEAVSVLEMALAVTRDVGDLIGEAYTLVVTGVAKVRQGDFRSADDALRRALELAEVVGQPVTEGRALLGLCELMLTSGNRAQAFAYGQRASAIFRELGASRDDDRAVALLGQMRAALGEVDDAAGGVS